MVTRNHIVPVVFLIAGALSWCPGQDCNQDGVSDANQTAPFTGGALRFGPGYGDYIEIPNATTFAPPTSVTFEWWQEGLVAQQATALLSVPYVPSNCIGANTPWVDGKVYFQYGDALGAGGLSTAPLGALTGWHHWAFTSGPLFGMRIYRDGVLLGSSPTHGTFTLAGSSLRLFAPAAGGTSLAGKLADFRFYSAERSQTQIQADMASGGVAAPDPTLILTYRFESTTGPVIADLSGNLRAGTHVGPYSWSKWYRPQGGTLEACVAPTITAQPSASPGVAAAGQSVAITPPTVTTAPLGWASTYQWLRDGVPIGSPATSPPTTLLLSPLDCGAELRIRVGHQWPDNPASFAAPASAFADSAPLPLSVLLPQSPGLINPANGHRYRLLGGVFDLQDARVLAYSVSGRLATIDDAAEQAWVTANFGSSPFRIGYTDELTQGTFRWDDGSSGAYSNWGAGQPAAAGNADSTILSPLQSGAWSATPSSAHYDALVEIDTARQHNRPTASLVLEGFDGPPWPVPVLLNAATYGSLSPSLTTVVSGVPNAPFAIFFAADTSAFGLVVPPLGMFDLDLGTFGVFIDGTGLFAQPANPVAVTGLTGQTQFELTVFGLPVGFTAAVQALVYDPTVSGPVPFSLTAASKLSIVSNPLPAIYVRTTGLPTAPGTISQPLNTVQAAINLSFNTPGHPPVYVDAGTYAETLTFRDGVSVYGGCDHSTWIPGSAGVTTITCANTGCVASQITTPTALRYLRIESADAPDGLSPPANSQALLIVDSTSALAISHCGFTAGDGGDGIDGPAGFNGASHPYSSGYQGDHPGWNGTSSWGGNGGAGSTSPVVGTLGDSGNPSPSGAQGGHGGHMCGCANSIYSYYVSWPSGGMGVAGMDGADGASGSGGAGSYGTFLALTASGLVCSGIGAAGTPGQYGLGGGGGGGGGSDLTPWFIIPCALQVSGGFGGGGGGGAVMGGAGVGGTCGGASVVIYLSNSSPVFDTCTFEAATGGRGGDGGAGGNGGVGANGHPGYFGAQSWTSPVSGDIYAGKGGPGGKGGDGGNGGGGGASTGGPSICFVTQSGGPTVINPAYVPGVGGLGGIGGAGGVNPNTSPLPGGSGGPGAVGLSGVAFP